MAVDGEAGDDVADPPQQCADPAFHLTRADLDELMDARRFVGRAPEQVDRFLESWVEPVLARHQDAARERVGAPEVRV